MSHYSSPDIRPRRKTQSADSREVADILELREQLLRSREYLECPAMIRFFIEREVPRLVAIAAKRRKRRVRRPTPERQLDAA